MVLGAIEITRDELVSIAAAVGSTAIVMAKEATSFDDIKEANALAKIHFKLLKALESAKDKA